MSVRYFVQTRFLFQDIPYEKSQRIQNEVRIYKRPEYIYSEMPSGYEPDEDPFEYVDRAVLDRVIEVEVEETKNEEAAVDAAAEEEIPMTVRTDQIDG